MSTVANADTNFVGHWGQADSKKNCSVVLGFLLKPGGAASVDWASIPSDDSSERSHFRVEQRDGHWRSLGDTLHLSVIDVLSNPTVLRDLGTATPISTEIGVDGMIVSGGSRLAAIITDNRDRNIDGQPYAIHCSYLRDKP